MLGQFIAEWKLNNSNQAEVVQIPVNDISQGTYILKVKTSTGNAAKKVIIQ
ncbi:MAG: T9SS type A sorting domain-containing protein [Flavobacterium sp.]|nr:T9SS type A sorting domain-containing protein [Flavobacterium sp.]